MVLMVVVMFVHMLSVPSSLEGLCKYSSRSENSTQKSVHHSLRTTEVYSLGSWLPVRISSRLVPLGFSRGVSWLLLIHIPSSLLSLVYLVVSMLVWVLLVLWMLLLLARRLLDLNIHPHRVHCR